MADGYSHMYTPRTIVDWTSNQTYQQFRLWRKEVQRIVNGPMSKDADSVKLNTVFIWAGAHAEQLVEAKQDEDPNLKIETVPALLDCLEECLTHSTFFREAREDFYNARQKAGENATAFYSRRMELYRLADFPENTDFLIVDKLVLNYLNSECKRKLMAKKKDATVKQCLECMRSYEAVEVTMRKFEDSCKVNASYSLDPTKKSQKNGSRVKKHQATHTRPCSWCNGDSHPHDQFPAKDTTCDFCAKKGHLEKACFFKKKVKGRTKQKSQNAVAVANASSDDEEYTPSFDMDVVSISRVKDEAREVPADVEFHTRKLAVVKGKVDTGAMVTCMPLGLLSNIGLCHSDLKPSTAKLHGVTGTDMNTHGELNVRATCNDHTHNVKVMVTELGNELILGLDFCKKFNLVSISDACIQRTIALRQKIEAVHITDESEVNYQPLQKKWKHHLPLGKKTGDALEDLKLIFPDMFDGTVGLFKGEVNLKLAPDAQPVQLPPRSIALSVLPKLKQELDKMENQGIIRPCPEATDWVHNLVVVSKKNGDIRICLDPRNLNKHLVRNVHYTASFEDALHSLKNGKYFSTLDAKSGYWTKMLGESSQLLTAFNTPFKKYCFVRLPFGLSVSSEIFCAEMDQSLAGIPGTFPCADDVKVQGSTESHHDINLLETVEKAKKASIKFNPEKCQIKQAKVSYFGRIISQDGVEPCPKKVKAMQDMVAPKNKQELQSFFGTVNFMATFIPNLAGKTHMMRSLLKKDSHFVWTQDMESEFLHVKQAISSAVALSHFDANKPAVIETDASLKGLGVVLCQDGRPVKFLSKSLTRAESEYSNIERELLAVLYACERLHIYTYGRTVTVHTDHKPLESIFLKPISLAPARLQRMLLRLRTYNLDVKYVGAKSVLLADTLSRLIKPDSHPPIPDLDVNIAQVMQISPTKLESLQEETKADSTLAELSNCIVHGWPQHMSELSESIQPYWCFRDELAILDGLIMKGCRVVMPSTMRAETLKKLHDGHQGQTATLQRARRIVYWPKLQNDVSDLLLRCDECQRHGKRKPTTSEKQISTVRPMEMMGMDLMDFQGQPALVAVDYFSGYVTVDHTKRETSEAVIACLTNNFRKFGLPESIISDNGPCFKSERFASFCNDHEIAHRTSSPYYHQSNGRAERAIQTIEQIFKKCKTDGEITMALLAYHDTPISSDLPSPAELFFNRRINTRLGLMYQPTLLAETQKTKLMEKRAAHLSPPKNITDEYTPNQMIWFTEDGTPEWKPGHIESKDINPDSYWIISADNQRRFRRNRHDIKPRLPMLLPQTRPISDVLQNHPLQNLQTPGDSHQHQAPALASPQVDSHNNSADLPRSPDATPGTPSPVPIGSPTTCPSGAATPSRPITRFGRHLKPNKKPDFIYQCNRWK